MQSSFVRCVSVVDWISPLSLRHNPFSSALRRCLENGDALGRDGSEWYTMWYTAPRGASTLDTFGHGCVARPLIQSTLTHSLILFAPWVEHKATLIQSTTALNFGTILDHVQLLFATIPDLLVSREQLFKRGFINPKLP